MTDTNTLIRLTIEIEGLLRVLAERNDADVRALLAEKSEIHSAAIRQYLGQTVPVAEPEPEPAPLPEPEPEAPVREPEPAPVTEPEPMPVPVPEVPAAQEPVLCEAPATETTENQKLLRAFTLNDKFRFRRELFNGDIEDFADTLSLLAHMPSYDEAVDYLTNDLLWDTRNPAVEDFFAILKDNMPS